MAFDTTFPDGFLWARRPRPSRSRVRRRKGSIGLHLGHLRRDWRAMSRTRTPGDPACEHYHRMPQDVVMMKALGLDAYRFSVAWPRSSRRRRGRERGRDRLLRSSRRSVAGQRDSPFVTLYHWDLPQVLDDRGGWLSRDSAPWFGEYAAAVVGRLGDRVRNWTTLNEPGARPSCPTRWRTTRPATRTNWRDSSRRTT